MNPRFDRLIPYYRFPDLFAPLVGDKYKPNEKKEEFVGLKNAKMIWQTTFGVGDSVAGAGTSGLTLDRFDTTTQADAALIRLVNNSGSTKTMRGCVIRGKPIIRYSGDQGYIHDSLINYDDIIENGEKKFEFGNNYVAAADHLKKLADLHWKNQKSKRHIYQVEISGRCHWYSPGEWYTLVAVSDSENINAVCECCDVQIEGGRDTAGRTVLTLREVYQNWTFNINAVARFIGQGGIHKIFSHNKIKVASSTYTKAADYYLDGVADQVEINKAINDLAGMGGGTVEITEGIIKIDAPIVPANNIAIIGQSWNTVIEKNGNFAGIALAGSGGNEYQNIQLHNFKITRNAADNNAQHLIDLQYCDKTVINNVWAYNSKATGIQLYECDEHIILNCQASFCVSGIIVYTIAVGGSIIGRIMGCNICNNSDFGIGIKQGAYCTLVGNTITNNTFQGIYILDSNQCTIEGNIAINNGDGITIHKSDNNVIVGNLCRGNTNCGIKIDNIESERNVVAGNRATANGTNFSNGGTDTTISGNDFV